MREINVLSCFDGLSGGQIALERARIKVGNYFASEIDKFSIQVTQHNYPDTIQLGSIENWKKWKLPKIDLIIGGSPCQGFSNAGKGLNFEDPRSKLFFTYCDILADQHGKNKNIKYMLENVKMKNSWADVITDRMKVNPMLIDSSLVSAQSRKRMYWANWKFDSPKDKHIYLKDILEPNPNPKYIISGKRKENFERNFEYRSEKQWVALNPEKALCMTSRQYANWYGNHVHTKNGLVRQLTPVECERLQTIPDNYTSSVSDTQRYKMLGNGWTIDVIAHIFSYLDF